MRAFLDAEHHHGALFRLAALTGLRRGELCGLRWADVDFDGARLVARHTITTVNHQPVEGDVKPPRSRRAIDLDPLTVATLRQHRKVQLEQRMLMGSGYRDRDLVFASVTGESWNPDSIGRAFARAVARAPSAYPAPRSAPHARDAPPGAGVNVKIVSERLGHATVGFTLDVHGHVMPGQQADAATAVAALVDRGTS